MKIYQFNRIHLIIFSLLLYFIVGCNGKDDIEVVNKNTENIDVKISNAALIKYSELYDSIHFIKLETNEESIIGRIDKILYYDNKYYIMDQLISKAILVFDNTGQFIRRLGHIGNGPGEFSEPNDIAIDPYRKRIVIYNNNGKNLLSYNTDGEFVEEIKLGFFIKSFTVLAKDIYALYFDYTLNDIPESLKYNLIIINKDGKILGKAFKMDDQLGIKLGGLSFFQRTNKEEILLSPGFTNKIYSIKLDSLIPKYNIDFGENNIPNKMFSENTTKSFFNNLRGTSYTYISSYIETSDFLIFKFPMQGTLYSGIYCKTTGNYKFSSILMNDLNLISGPIMAAQNNNTVISLYEPRNVNSIKELYVHSSDINRLKSNLVKQFDSYYSKNNLTSPVYNQYIGAIRNADFIITDNEITLINALNPSDNPVLIIGEIKIF